MNLKKHHKNLKIASATKATEFRNMRMSEPDWVMERDLLIKSMSGDKVFPTKQHIFIIELKTIRNARHQNISFDVLVSLNKIL